MNASADPLEPIFELLAQLAGLAFPAARRESACQAIRRAIERTGVGGPQDYLQLLRGRGKAFDELVDELSVGETYFFREPEQLDFLRRHILPEVCSRRGPGHVLRAWSAGCASGEEAYSLAIVLDQEGLGEQSLIVATDLSGAALDRGRRACYRDWSLRGPAADRARPYLQAKGELFEVVPALRRRVRFLPLNLVEGVYPSPVTGVCDMDVILCRNVLIYLHRSAVAPIAVRLFETLAPGGWLLPGPSDPLLGRLAPLETVTTEHGLVYRRPLVPLTPRGEGTLLSPSPLGGEGLGVRGSSSLQDPAPSPPTPLPRGERGGREEPPHPRPLSPEGRGEEEGAELLERARQAAAAGAYQLASELAGQVPGSVAASLLRVRALANVDTAAATEACAAALEEHTLAAELHYLHSVLLFELGRLEEAEQAARRLLYLNPALPLAHFTLGSILWRRGDRAGARRGYVQARELACQRPADELLLLEEETAGSFVAAVDAQLNLLDALGESVP